MSDAITDLGGLQGPPFSREVNFSQAQLFTNIGHACQLDLADVAEGEPTDEPLTIVCSGTSIDATNPHEAGGKLLSVNAAHDWLIEKGCPPWGHFVCDANAVIAGFTQKPHKDTTYFVASQCPKQVFDALDGHKIQLCHMLQNMGEMDEIKRYREQFYMVGGGSTVGIRSIYLAYHLGFRNLHIHGFDSCFKPDRHHAGNDMIQYQDVCRARVGDKVFLTTPIMMLQARQFIEVVGRDDIFKDLEITLYGTGMVVEMLKFDGERKKKPIIGYGRGSDGSCRPLTYAD